MSKNTAAGISEDPGSGVFISNDLSAKQQYLTAILIYKSLNCIQIDLEVSIPDLHFSPTVKNMTLSTTE